MCAACDGTAWDAYLVFPCVEGHPTAASDGRRCCRCSGLLLVGEVEGWHVGGLAFRGRRERRGSYKDFSKSSCDLRGANCYVNAAQLSYWHPDDARCLDNGDGCRRLRDAMKCPCCHPHI